MASPWHASFISADGASHAGDPARYFRREFTTRPGLVRATLVVSGLGIVVPYVNGEQVGDEVLAPGWTSYRHRIGARAHDVTASLTAGANAVGAIVGEGWAVGRVGWEGKRHHWADRPALFLELKLEYEDGAEFIVSDAQFRVGEGAVRSNGIYDGEEFDARRLPAGWSLAGFDDAQWPAAQPFDWPTDVVEVDAAPPIRRIEEIAPVRIRTTAPGRAIVDFGQNLAGWVRLTVSGEAGRTITLRFAELLTLDGELETDTNRSAAATDRYTLRSESEETWEPAFTFHGFQYVEIDGWPGDVTADALRAIVVHSDMRRTGWFEASDPLVSRLHDNAVWSMRSNFVGVPTDCPQRDERLGWTGDINVFGPTAGLLHDVRAVLGSWLKDVAAEQKAKGYVPWVVPDILSTPSSPTAIWSDVAVSLPWTLYQEYGDLEILRQSYDSMAAFVRQVEGQLDETGLWSSGFQFGDWLDPDAPYDDPAGGRTDRHLVASAYLCRITRELADSATLLGHDADAAHFDTLAHRTREAFRREYVSESGRVMNESATAYALAICFGILDESQRAKAGDRLADLVAKAGFRIATGFAGTPYVTEALSSTGHLEEAYLLLMQKQSPSFLYPVTMGATTTWERWDSLLPDGTLKGRGMTSLNHYALGAVVEWLYSTVGGIGRIEPGYRSVLIHPRPGGGLTSARAAHDTVQGRIEVAWRVEGETVSLDITVPDGVDAEVILPLHPDGHREKVTAGEHTWTYVVEGLGRRAAHTLDTPIGALAEDRTLWYAVAAVLEKNFPGMSLDPSPPEASSMSLATLLGYIPTVPEGVEEELRSALAAPPVH
ncbi:family 78 glycoside hydrolase catalytic domain [Streptomyces sp. NPDC050433]|uniref:alpha-L-rhamnosidase n=1 Tax=Streptomyces sp. NPDC050433 TaxID=3365615 RepID=UPI003798B8FD